MKQRFRTLTGVVGLIGITLTFLFGPVSLIPGMVERVLHFFSYFTILTNSMTAAAMLGPVLFPSSRTGRLLDRAGIRVSITAFMMIVGVIYHFLLFDDLMKREGAGFAASILCHYVVPVMALIDWFLFVPRGRASWNDPLRMLLYPVIYVVWTLLHGSMTGWYPYPFLDVGVHGTAGVLSTVLGISGLFLLFVSFLMVADRRAAASE